MKPFPFAVYPYEVQKSGFGRRSLFGGSSREPSREQPSTEQPSAESAPQKTSIINQLLNKFTFNRRKGIQGSAAIAADPKTAGKIAVEAVAPGASTAVSAVTTALPKVANVADLVRQVGSQPSAETWISTGRGMVRGAQSGLIGMLVPGASKVAASMSPIAGKNAMERIRALLRSPRVHDEMTREMQGDDSASSFPGWMHTAKELHDQGQLSTRSLTEALLRDETARNWLGKFATAGGVQASDLVEKVLPNSGGFTVYVLPAEHQTRHIGPVRHFDSEHGGVIQLSPHPDEADHYERMDAAVRPHLAQDQINAQLVESSDRTIDNAIQMRNQINEAKRKIANGEELTPDDWHVLERDSGYWGSYGKAVPEVELPEDPSQIFDTLTQKQKEEWARTRDGEFVERAQIRESSQKHYEELKKEERERREKEEKEWKEHKEQLERKKQEQAQKQRKRSGFGSRYGKNYAERAAEAYAQGRGANSIYQPFERALKNTFARNLPPWQG